MREQGGVGNERRMWNLCSHVAVCLRVYKEQRHGNRSRAEENRVGGAPPKLCAHVHRLCDSGCAGITPGGPPAGRHNASSQLPTLSLARLLLTNVQRSRITSLWAGDQTARSSTADGRYLQPPQGGRVRGRSSGA